MSFYVPSKQDYAAFPTTCNDEIILKAFISLFLSLSCLPASTYPKNSLVAKSFVYIMAALLLFLRCFPGLKKYSTFSGLPPPTALHFPPPFKFRLHKTLEGRLIATLRVYSKKNNQSDATIANERERNYSKFPCNKQ